MRKIAHIINPVDSPINSGLNIAQPITFESLLLAKEFASQNLNIEIFSAQFSEDRKIIPGYILPTPDLTRSVLDIQYFENKRKLPLIKDILDRLYSATNAEYLIYSNIDISPLPMFYMTIEKIIEAGFDSFVINRRTIFANYKPELLYLMFADLGGSHPGHDCFIFKRDSYQSFELGSVCIGAPFVGRVLLWNMIIFSKAFKEFKDLHLTFHLGNEKVWKLAQYDEYQKFNKIQAISILHSLERIKGPFNRSHNIYPYLIPPYSKRGYFSNLVNYVKKYLLEHDLTKSK